MPRRDPDSLGSLEAQHDPDAPMTLTDAQRAIDGGPAPMPTVSMDPLQSAMPLKSASPDRRDAPGPYAAPIRGSTHRPVFRPADLDGPQRLPVETLPNGSTQTHDEWVRKRRAREAQQTRTEVEAQPRGPILAAPLDDARDRRIAALEADVADLRVRIARIEPQLPSRTRSGSRFRPRHDDDTPPAAA